MPPPSQIGVLAALGADDGDGAVLDGLEVGSVLVAVLGLVTLWFTATSVRTLLFPPEGSGVFFSGVLALYAGFGLGLAVVLRTQAHLLVPDVGPKVRARLE